MCSYNVTLHFSDDELGKKMLVFCLDGYDMFFLYSRRPNFTPMKTAGEVSF
jgi:hypothetical protein